MSIELWAARLDRTLTEPETAAMLALLPSARRERLLRIRQPEKRREPLCAYFILRRALLEQYRWQEIPPMALAERGKPYFPDHPGVHFSLSHTSGAVLVGLSGQPLGVDIERVRPVRAQAMRRLAGGAAEQDFFQRWVRWEALGKCRGAGVAPLLASDAPLRQEERFYALDTFPGYAAGAAAHGSEPLGVLRRYPMSELL